MICFPIDSLAPVRTDIDHSDGFNLLADNIPIPSFPGYRRCSVCCGGVGPCVWNISTYIVTPARLAFDEKRQLIPVSLVCTGHTSWIWLYWFPFIHVGRGRQTLHPSPRSWGYLTVQLLCKRRGGQLAFQTSRWKTSVTAGRRRMRYSRGESDRVFFSFPLTLYISGCSCSPSLYTSHYIPG
jgi:hypothetical protein